MLDILTIGDGMITMNPKTKGPLRFVHEFERKIGGAELNTLIGCARLGLRTGWISRLGNDEFGRHLFNTVRGEGVDMTHVQLVDEYPTSVNFKEILETGAGRTFYYRQDSPTSTLTPESLAPEMFEQTRLFHITGVFPAIAPNNIDIIRQGIRLAKEAGTLISLDPNIRLKLWSAERAREVLTSFLPDVDLLLTGKEEAALLTGEEEEQAMIRAFQGYGIETIAIKKGANGSLGVDGNEQLEMPPADPGKVVDTVGAGDGFNAGFILGILNEWPLKQTLAFANTVGAMVVSVMGDNEGLPVMEEVQTRLGKREVIQR